MLPLRHLHSLDLSANKFIRHMALQEGFSTSTTLCSVQNFSGGARLLTHADVGFVAGARLDQRIRSFAARP